MSTGHFGMLQNAGIRIQGGASRGFLSKSLNGECWGFYYLTEKCDAQYIEYYYGIDNGTQSDNIIMIKNGTVEVGEDDDELSYSKMLKFITTSDISSTENYQKACELIDIQSYIDYHAALVYVSRCGD